jgi:hypothetical protein
MEEKVKEGDKVKTLLGDIRKALGIAEDADPLAAIAAAMQKLGAEAKACTRSFSTRSLSSASPATTTRPRHSARSCGGSSSRPR